MRGEIVCFNRFEPRNHPLASRVNIYSRPVTNKADVYGPSMEKEGAHEFIVPFSLSHTWWNKNKESERNLIEKVGQAKTKGVQSWSSLLY